MKKKKYKIATIILLFALSICLKVSGQKVELKVGDKAPPINVFKWLKGNEVKEFQKGKVYMVEFSATWCVPCKKVIPHLSTLSNMYKNEAEVLSFYVMEMNTEPLDTKQPKYVQKVENFIKKQGNNIQYNIAVDTPDSFMQSNWLRPAGISGVPHAFIVDKEGYIAWIDVSTAGKGLGALKQAMDYALSYDYKLNHMINQAKQREAIEAKFNPNTVLADKIKEDEEQFLFRSAIKKSNKNVPVAQNMHFDTRPWHDSSLPEKYRREKGKMKWFNMLPIDLYRLAYGDTLPCILPDHRRPEHHGKFFSKVHPYAGGTVYGEIWHTPILEVENPKLVGETIWKNRKFKSADNKYHYSIQVPKEQANVKFLQQTMQNDLKNYFGYDVSVQIREMPCWKIKIKDKAIVRQNLRTKTIGQNWRYDYKDGEINYNNTTIESLVYVLAFNFGYRTSDYGLIDLEDQAPFIDETGIDYEIDLFIPKQAKTSFQAFNTYLESIGLYLEKSTKHMKVIVIRDSERTLNQ
ncbi:TlpA disulfide reductase family protein [Flavivirga amylovorans]|uniref:TlpA disulfide reductase family protein n=1 Tax=Flavivirga amylovorans TaxID=870486 RepID=A0ABT8X0R9_9FLAO|nr:TlpA disulfide reductase family protein [Flavivirga amylovorans]MDO5987524.1 TlpA disulfide reductase family protein [Flavivirga amylovorans]